MASEAVRLSLRHERLPSGFFKRSYRDVTLTRRFPDSSVVTRGRKQLDSICGHRSHGPGRRYPVEQFLHAQSVSEQVLGFGWGGERFGDERKPVDSFQCRGELQFLRNAAYWSEFLKGLLGSEKLR